MASPGTVIGWRLDQSQREELLERFPPQYRDAIADHVTLKINSERDELPGPVASAIVGRADDGDSLECMVVTINGTVERPDGSTFHITWSLDKSKGRHARESNDLLKRREWSTLAEPLPIKLEPARF